MTIATRLLAGIAVLLCELAGAGQDAHVVLNAADLEWRELGPYSRAVTTRFGELSVHLLGPDDDRATFVEIRLAGELVVPPMPRRGDLFLMSLRSVFEHGERDVVVATASTGGSAARERLLLVEVRRDGTGSVTTDPLFRSLDSTELVAADGERLHFDLGYDGGRRKTATFDGGAITFAYADVEPHPIPQDRCRLLFEVMTDACMRTEQHPRWGAPGDLIQGPFNGATARSLLELSHHPGFQREEFLRQCAAAPRLERAPTYEAFASAICEPEG